MVTKKYALEKFKKEVCENSKEIDPNEEYDWYSLSLGFFLALGANVEDASKWCIEVRYDHRYWM